MPDVLVVNASPLIFLGNSGHLRLLRDYGASRVMVPTAVLQEITEGGHADAAARAVFEADWLERIEPMSIPDAVIEWDLGVGESAVIAAAMATEGARPVIDDLTGRRCARAFGMSVVGTLGLVIRAYRHGEVEDPLRLMLDLKAAGMWLDDRVIARALALAGWKSR